MRIISALTYWPVAPSRSRAWRSTGLSFPSPDTGPPSPAPRVHGAGPDRVVIVAWRDVASPQAGGSELLVDQLAAGLTARGDQVTLLCGGPVADHDYDVVRSGGRVLAVPAGPVRLRAPAARLRRAWSRCATACPSWRRCGRASRPCAWSTTCTAICGHCGSARRSRRPAGSWNSASCPGRTAATWCSPCPRRPPGNWQSLGVDRERIRHAEQRRRAGRPPVPRSAEPMFLALGRLAEYKRIDLLLRLWDRVRPVVGGRLIIAGDGPRARLSRVAGRSRGHVHRPRSARQEKHRLLGSAWLLVHPALIEGWGIVVAEAAVRGTPTVGFDVPGLRDSVVHDRRPACWPAPRRGSPRPGRPWPWTTGGARRWVQAARRRAARLRWSTAVQHFSAVIDEAIGRRVRRATMTAARPLPEPASPLRAFYEHPATTVSSGPDRAHRQARMLAAILARAERAAARSWTSAAARAAPPHVIKRLDPAQHRDRHRLVGDGPGQRARAQACW